MNRIIRFNTYRDLQPLDRIQAIEVVRQAAEAVAKVPGVESCKLHLSTGNFVFVVEIKNFGVADAILEDPGVQAAGARMVAEFGLQASGDEFLADIEQLMPFLKK